MADTKLVGRNYTPPDLMAKVTGRARYAEDFRAEGMLFAKLLLSPMPHARVTGIDASGALAMPGVKAILTVDDLPPSAQAGAERVLTDEPLYLGEPILAVAAMDEVTAADAIERIVVTFEPLALRRRSGREPEAGWRKRAARGKRVVPAGALGARRAAESTGHPHAEVDARTGRLKPPKAACRWGRRPRSGRTAISRPASATPRRSSTRRSWSSPQATSRWKPDRRWPTGRTASCF